MDIGELNNEETTDLGDPNVEKQPNHMGTFQFDGKGKTVPGLVMTSCFSWIFFLADSFRH